MVSVQQEGVIYSKNDQFVALVLLNCTRQRLHSHYRRLRTLPYKFVLNNT
jgi:hypothetical protein